MLRQLKNTIGTDQATGLQKEYIVTNVQINLGIVNNDTTQNTDTQEIRVDYIEIIKDLNSNIFKSSKKYYSHRADDADGAVRIENWDNTLGAVIGDAIKNYMNTYIYGI